MRTMAKGLAHKQVVEDSALCDVAGADYLLLFRKRGENPVPIAHPVGLLDYAGERRSRRHPARLSRLEGQHTENRYSHWIWRQYASAFWDDIRIDRVLPFRKPRSGRREARASAATRRHRAHRDRCARIPAKPCSRRSWALAPRSMAPCSSGRKGIGIELKASYFKQADEERLPFVRDIHRRLPRVQGAMWAVSDVDDGNIVGVALVGHPARELMTDTLSVLRVAVIEGHPNVCSMLYGSCSRAAKAMGADNLVTYTHGDEHGASLKASNWISDGMTDGGEYSRPSRHRALAVDSSPKRRWWAPWSARVAR
jgi:hypothetical protein